MSDKIATLLIRADAGAEMGTGHVMRCLALAQGWQDAGGDVVLAAAEILPPLEARLIAEKVRVERTQSQRASNDDARWTIEMVWRHRAQAVVMDGYHFGAHYQRALYGQGFRTLVVDDYGHSDRYYADSILNQNLSADERLYRDRPASCSLLLGTKYILLRREYRRLGQPNREIPELALRLLVTMGGIDEDNATLKVLRALNSIEQMGLEVTALVGGGNQHIGSLETQANNMLHEVRLLSGVADLPALLSEIDLAISAAGTTTWELAYMGVPTVLVVAADNQRENAARMGAAGAAMNLGDAGALSEDAIAKTVENLIRDRNARTAFSLAGRKLVDGKGAERVIEVIK